MKHYRLFLMMSFLFTSYEFAFAKNKQQVHFYNNYGSDVTLDLLWEPDTFWGFTRSQQIVLHSKEEVMIKSPVSAMHLDSIDAVPSQSHAGQEIIQGGLAAAGFVSDLSDLVDIGYGLNHALNHETINTSGNRFFIVTKTTKKSYTGKQYKIIIKRFHKQADYEKELGKINPKLIQNKETSTKE